MCVFVGKLCVFEPFFCLTGAREQIRQFINTYKLCMYAHHSHRRNEKVYLLCIFCFSSFDTQINNAFNVSHAAAKSTAMHSLLCTCQLEMGLITSATASDYKNIICHGPFYHQKRISHNMRACGMESCNYEYGFDCKLIEITRFAHMQSPAYPAIDFQTAGVCPFRVRMYIFAKISKS